MAVDGAAKTETRELGRGIDQSEGSRREGRKKKSERGRQFCD